MTKLSVNINKVATLRNARGGNNPDVVQVALDCEKFGAQGITVHPRPDERHIRYQDVYDLKAVLRTEFNIEGNPVDKFNDLVLKVRPTQVTLVPDAPDQITSNAGWDTKKNLSFLTEIIGEFKEKGIRTSIFVNQIIYNFLNFFIRDKGSLHPHRLWITGWIEQHISFSQQLFCPVHINDRTRIHSR